MSPSHRLNHNCSISITLGPGEVLRCMLCEQEIHYASEPVIMFADPKIDREPSIAMYHPDCFQRMSWANYRLNNV